MVAPTSATASLSVLPDQQIDLYDETVQRGNWLKKCSLLMSVLLVFAIFASATIGLVTNTPAMWVATGLVALATAGAGLSYYLSRNGQRQYYQLAAWLLLGSLLGLISCLCWLFGNQFPMVLSFSYAIVLALLLIPFRQVVGLAVGCFVVYAVSAIQPDLLTDYKPPIVLPPAGQFLADIIVLGFTLTAILAMIRVALQNQLRAIHRQNKQLLQALENLHERSNLNQQTGQRLSSLASQLSGTATQQASGSQEQAATLSQVTSFLQELAHTAASIAHKADQVLFGSQQVHQSVERVRRSADEVLEAGEQGAQAVENTIQANEQLCQLQTRLKTTLQELTQRQNQIRQVMTLVRSISGQTHLLSLNAAIEAAGTAQHGERFAVIAAEVKALADQTIQATANINEIISELESGIDEAVRAAEQGYRESQTALRVARESGGFMAELAATIQQNVEEVAGIEQAIELMKQHSSEINYATSQQASASRQAVETLQSIATVASQTAQNSLEVTRSAHEMEELSEDLFRNLTLVA